MGERSRLAWGVRCEFVLNCAKRNIIGRFYFDHSRSLGEIRVSHSSSGAGHSAASVLTRGCRLRRQAMPPKEEVGPIAGTSRQSSRCQVAKGHLSRFLYCSLCGRLFLAPSSASTNGMSSSTTSTAPSRPACWHVHPHRVPGIALTSSARGSEGTASETICPHHSAGKPTVRRNSDTARVRLNLCRACRMQRRILA